MWIYDTNNECWAEESNSVVSSVKVGILYFWKISDYLKSVGGKKKKKKVQFSKLEYRQRGEGNHRQCMLPPNIIFDTAICCCSPSEYTVLYWCHSCVSQTSFFLLCWVVFSRLCSMKHSNYICRLKSVSYTAVLMVTSTPYNCTIGLKYYWNSLLNYIVKLNTL